MLSSSFRFPALLTRRTVPLPSRPAPEEAFSSLSRKLHLPDQGCSDYPVPHQSPPAYVRQGPSHPDPHTQTLRPVLPVFSHLAVRRLHRQKYLWLCFSALPELMPVRLCFPALPELPSAHLRFPGVPPLLPARLQFLRSLHWLPVHLYVPHLPKYFFESPFSYFRRKKTSRPAALLGAVLPLSLSRSLPVPPAAQPILLLSVFVLFPLSPVPLLPVLPQTFLPALPSAPVLLPAVPLWPAPQQINRVFPAPPDESAHLLPESRTFPVRHRRFSRRRCRCRLLPTLLWLRLPPAPADHPHFPAVLPHRCRSSYSGYFA